jgi:predicted NUDIX family phosphoesterase
MTRQTPAPAAPQTSQELVLAVPRAAFEAIVPGRPRGGRDGFHRAYGPSPELPLTALWRAATALPRAPLETDRAYKQLATYCLVTYGGLIFAYRRAKGSGEGRLLGKGSIGVGGHVSLEDAEAVDPRFAGFGAAAAREVREELNPAGDFGLSFAGLVNDDRDPVGRVHLGLVFVARLATAPVLAPSPEVEPVGWLRPEQLTDVEGLERWSQILAPVAAELVGPS